MPAGEFTSFLFVENPCTQGFCERGLVGCSIKKKFRMFWNDFFCTESCMWRAFWRPTWVLICISLLNLLYHHLVYIIVHCSWDLINALFPVPKFGITVTEALGKPTVSNSIVAHTAAFYLSTKGFLLTNCIYIAHTWELFVSHKVSFTWHAWRAV